MSSDPRGDERYCPSIDPLTGTRLCQRHRHPAGSLHANAGRGAGDELVWDDHGNAGHPDVMGYPEPTKDIRNLSGIELFHIELPPIPLRDMGSAFWHACLGTDGGLPLQVRDADGQVIFSHPPQEATISEIHEEDDKQT